MHKKCWRQQKWDNMGRPNIFFRKVLFRYFPMRVQPFLYDKWFGSYARSNVGHWPFSCSWRENITFPYTFIYSCLTTAKHMQMTSNLNTSKIKIIKTIPESLVKIRRHDVMWRHMALFPNFCIFMQKEMLTSAKLWMYDGWQIYFFGMSHLIPTQWGVSHFSMICHSKIIAFYGGRCPEVKSADVSEIMTSRGKFWYLIS